jgi:hypothetical protein
VFDTVILRATSLLWELFRKGMTEHKGLYLNLETMKVNPVDV